MSRFHATSDDLPAGLPPEVFRQIDVAWGRARELFDSDVDIHFEMDAGNGRVWAELRSADGRVVERLSPAQALALGCGTELDPEPVAT